MKNIAKITVAALVLLSVALESCKKGEGDPALSLRSRKARMAGEWKVSKGEGTETSGNSTSTFTFDGTTVTQTSNNITFSFGSTMEATLEKDGTFKSVSTTTINNSTTTTNETGIWNFTSGVGEAKNKSQLVMMTLSSTTTTGSSTDTETYTGSNAPSVLYDIYQLKSKEIILKQEGSNTDSNGTSTSSSTWTWSAK
ncbi:MAG: hypothetical protein ACRCYO_17130 [Bacteroidia bacterium]